jgi:protein gp37
MADHSTIEHVDASWNPVSGCRPCSPGCAHCFAARLTAEHDPGRDFREIRLHPDRLGIPATWRQHRRILVCSMGDLFHPEVPAAFIGRVFRAMAASPQHSYLVLSKHPGRMGPVLYGDTSGSGLRAGQALPHVWLGTSIEDQTWTDRRLPLLLGSGWPGRFWVSAEPLLGPITLGAYLPFLAWAVGGGESGLDARGAHPAWVRSLRDQCLTHGLPWFWKQWGNRVHRSLLDDRSARQGIDEWVTMRSRAEGGRMLDGVEWTQIPPEIAGPHSPQLGLFTKYERTQ